MNHCWWERNARQGVSWSCGVWWRSQLRFINYSKMPTKRRCSSLWLVDLKICSTAVATNDHLFPQIWAHQANYRYSSGITDIGTSRFYYGNSAYVFVSMSDNTVHCLHRDTLKRGVRSIVSRNCRI